MSFSAIIASGQASLVASYRVLVCLQAAVVGLAVVTDPGTLIRSAVRIHLVSQWQVGRRYNLDKVHEVEVGIIRNLLDIIQRVEVVIGPRTVLRALLGDILRELGSETQLVHSVLKGVLHGTLPVVLQVVNMHVAIAETSAWRKVEVTNDLIDS